MKRSGFLKRGAPLKRTAMKRKRTRAKPSKADAAFLAFVRRQPCAMTGAQPPSHAHHPRTGTGTALKPHDSTAIPLSLVAHHDLHALSGAFKGWKREQLREWERAKNAEVRELYAAQTPMDTTTEPTDVF